MVLMPPYTQDQMLQMWLLASLLGLIPAAIARKKGRSFGLWWVYGSMIFIVALFHSLLIKPYARQVEQLPMPTPEVLQPVLPEGTKNCKFCGQLIDEVSTRCPVCKKDQFG